MRSARSNKEMESGFGHLTAIDNEPLQQSLKASSGPAVREEASWQYPCMHTIRCVQTYWHPYMHPQVCMSMRVRVHVCGLHMHSRCVRMC